MLHAFTYSNNLLRHAPMPVVVCKYIEKKGCEKCGGGGGARLIKTLTGKNNK